jgi:antitoxin (DNA-binding transcriptional repressor) of toxin-antitoxin stability system
MREVQASDVARGETIVIALPARSIARIVPEARASEVIRRGDQSEYSPQRRGRLAEAGPALRRSDELRPGGRPAWALAMTPELSSAGGMLSGKDRAAVCDNAIRRTPLLPR